MARIRFIIKKNYNTRKKTQKKEEFALGISGWLIDGKVGLRVAGVPVSALLAPSPSPAPEGGPAAAATRPSARPVPSPLGWRTVLSPVPPVFIGWGLEFVSLQPSSAWLNLPIWSLSCWAPWPRCFLLAKLGQPALESISLNAPPI